MTRVAQSRITAVLAGDDRFSKPLAVTVRSVVSQLSPGRGLDLYLCDMGITAPNRDKIATAAAHPDVRLRWVDTLGKEIGHLPEAVPGISQAAYARLFIPQVLPPGVDRALYLDCDLIVRRCVGELSDLPLGSFAALGVADAGSPYVSSLYGVPYWSRYGRRADEVNFNSGVLLLNLTAWLEEDITGAAVAYLTDGRHQFLVDQEAINAVLPGRIGPLDPRWNVQTEHFQPPHQATLPLDEAQLSELIKDPWIVHFTTAVKAWDYECTHPFRDEWFALLDQTPYGGWRAPRSAYYLGQARRLGRRVKGRLRPRAH
jgi:lipopolysaccharide biosynthesis glycosyltransferase